MSSSNENLIKSVINCAYKVHKTLGSGFLEKVYENALSIELRESDIPVQSQQPMKVFYKSQIVGDYFADIVVENQILLELKAVKTLLPEHSAQLINYLNATQITNGLLINFGTPKIEIKRLYGN